MYLEALTKWIGYIGGLGLSLCMTPALAQQLDPHKIYEGSCAGCHAPHAGDFVFDTLRLTKDGLAGRSSGKSVDAYLKAGHGNLSAAEADILLDHLLSIQNSGRVFHDKCKICHVSPVELAQLELVLRDDRLVGRYSGRDILQFLEGHGRLAPAEIPIVAEVLQRQLSYKQTR
jgi:cytochrome c5